MNISQDFEELFRILNAYKIKYLVVGAYAVIYYTEPRFTKDVDIWIIPDLNDPKKVYNALKQFGAPLRNVRPDNFLDRTMILHIGIAPIRVDILMDVPGVTYQKAWRNRKRTRYGRTYISLLGMEELIQVKRRTGRIWVDAIASPKSVTRTTG